MTTHPSIIASLSAALLAAPVRAAPQTTPADLIARGEARLAAGDRTGAVADFAQAHAELADPLAHRGERGDLVAILRTELLALHHDTSDPSHLCRLRAILIAHIEALLVALGPDVGPQSIVGSRTRLREIGELLAARHPRHHCACDAWQPNQRPLPLLGADDPIRIPAPTPSHTPTRTSQPPTNSARRMAGGVLTGVGVGLTSLLGITLGSYVLHHAAIRRIVEDDEAGRPIDDSVVAMHKQAALWSRGASIGLGAAATVVLSTGIGLLFTRQNERRTRLHISADSRGAALSWYLTF